MDLLEILIPVQKQFAQANGGQLTQPGIYFIHYHYPLGITK